MTKQLFKEQFVTAFLATWAANNADYFSPIKYRPPVDYAEYLAEETWKDLQDKGRLLDNIMGVKCENNKLT